MEAYAETWDERESEAERRGSRRHLRSVDSSVEELLREPARPKETHHDAARHDTDYWIAEAQRVREEVEELVRTLDAPHVRDPGRAAPSRSRARSAASASAEAQRARREMEELLREHEILREEAYGDPSGEDLEEDDDEPWMDELQEMREELEDLRRHVASMREARHRAPRRRPRASHQRRPSEESLPMKKLAMLMLIADLM